jgi:hypothetical protein
MENQIRDCAVLAEFRVSLRLAEASDDDDHLSVDLGKVKWLTPQIGQLGRIKSAIPIAVVAMR